MMAAGIVLAWLVAACLLLACVFRKSVANAWIEPVLRAPVLILESDDWGYGPPEQAAALDRLADVLARYRDARGAHPVMTLGVISPKTSQWRNGYSRSIP